MPAYTLEDGSIILHRELTALDIFVRDFLFILKNFTFRPWNSKSCIKKKYWARPMKPLTDLKNWFRGKDFKTEARKYLKGRGLV